MIFIRKYLVPISLFFTLWISSAYFYQAGGHNEAARIDSIRAIIEDHVTWIDRFAYNTADDVKNQGHLYSGKAPGASIFGLAPFAIFKLLLHPFHLSEDLKYHLISYFTTVFTVSLFSAFGCLILYFFLLDISKDSKSAAIVTLVYGFGTLAFPFSTLFFSHQLTASLLLICFYSVFSEKEKTLLNENHHKNLQGHFPISLAIGGFLGGMSFTTEYPAALGLFWIYCYFAFFCYQKRLWKKLFIFGSFSLLGLIPLFIYNHFAFHKIFFLSYEAYKNPEVTQFKEMATGFFGIHNPFSNPLFFHNLAEIIYKPQRGLLFFSPIFLLVIPGIILSFKQKRWRQEILVCLGIILSFVILNGSFGNSIVYWGGGYSFGPRYLVPALPFIGLPLLFVLQNKYLRPVFYFLAGLSCFICLAGTAVDPKVSYDFTNPLFQEIIPGFISSRFYALNYGIFSQTLITDDSVSFNLGSLIRLPPYLQLVPLYLFWVFLVFKGRKLFGRILPYGVLSLILIASLGQLSWALLNSNKSKVGFQGQYFRNETFSGKPFLVRTDTVLHFEWPKDEYLMNGIFSVIWNSELKIEKDDFYEFQLTSDDAGWLLIDNSPVINNPGAHAATTVFGKKWLTKGTHLLKVKLINYGGGAVIDLQWKEKMGQWILLHPAR